MPPSYSEEVLDRLMKGHADVVNEIVARRNKLEDIGSERQYEQTAAGEASKRRMAEYAEQERQRLVQKLAEKGVPVKATDTVEEMNSANRRFEQDRAGNMLDNFTHQLTQNAEEKQATVSELQRLASKQADPTVQREALTVTLANPLAVNGMRSDLLASAKAVLNGPGDPGKVVQKVYDLMQKDYWFFKDSAQKQASAFYQTYLTELNSRLDKSKQIDAAVLMNKLNDLDRGGQEILHQRDLHIASASGFLSKDQIKASHDAHAIAPPQNPADALKDLVKPSAGNPAPADAATALGPPAPSGAPPVQAPTIGEAFDTSGLPGAYGALSDKLVASNTRAVNAQEQVGRNLADALSGLFMKQPSTNAPSMADVQANRSRIDATLKPIVPTSDVEAQAVKQMGLRMGYGQDEIDTAEKAFQNGTATPAMIKVHNALIGMVRRQTGTPGSSGMTNMPPVGPIPDTGGQ